MDQQLVLAFAATSLADYDAIVQLEDELLEVLDGLADVDGHDTGGGVMQIFIWCDDAVRTFKTVKQSIGDRDRWRGVTAGWRHESADDYEPLWPPGLKRFELS